MRKHIRLVNGFRLALSYQFQDQLKHTPWSSLRSFFIDTLSDKILYEIIEHIDSQINE